MYLMLLIKSEKKFATLLSTDWHVDVIQHIIEQYIHMNMIQMSALNEEGRAKWTNCYTDFPTISLK